MKPMLKFRVLREVTVKVLNGVELEEPVVLKPGMYFIGYSDSSVRFTEVEVEEVRDDV